MNSYADIDTDLNSLLHGVARLHVTLGRMSNVGITTRGWSYNDLVDGIISLNSSEDLFIRQNRCVETLFDTLDAIVEIGSNGVSYLQDLKRFNG